MKVQIIVSDVEHELFLDWEFSSDGKPRGRSFGFSDASVFCEVVDVVVKAIETNSKGLKIGARASFEAEEGEEQ